MKILGRRARRRAKEYFWKSLLLVIPLVLGLIALYFLMILPTSSQVGGTALKWPTTSRRRRSRLIANPAGSRSSSTNLRPGTEESYDAAAVKSKSKIPFPTSSLLKGETRWLRT